MDWAVITNSTDRQTVSTRLETWQEAKKVVMKFLFLVISLSMAGCATSSATQSSSRPYHKYKPIDLGPSPFVDETTGQCTLNPCDALGRAKDELYSMFDEKEKVQSQSQTLIGELQQAVGEGKGAQEKLKRIIHLMEQRIRSLEQSGLMIIQTPPI